MENIKCPFCGKDLSTWSLDKREDHVFNCVQPSASQSFFEQNIVSNSISEPPEKQSTKAQSEYFPPPKTQDASLNETTQKTAQLDETKYDESFTHPMLKTNNKIFTPGYRNNLLTDSQCDSSLIMSPKQDSFSIEPDDFDPELPDLSTQGVSPFNLQETQPKSPEKTPSLADWNGDNNEVNLENVPAVPSSPSAVSSEVSSLQVSTTDEDIFGQLNETNANLEIRTIEDTLNHFKMQSEKTGTVIKYSKEGDKFSFHDFWLNVRCPALIHFNTKQLTTCELRQLHHVIYSIDTSSEPILKNYEVQKSFVFKKTEFNDTLPTPLTTQDEKSFVFRKRTSTLANETALDKSANSEVLFNSSKNLFGDETLTPTPKKQTKLNSNIAISNFDFDPSDDEGMPSKTPNEV